MTIFTEEGRKEVEALITKTSKGPWNICTATKCKCGLIDNNENEIASITYGEWGDTYGAIRLVGDSSLDRKAEAYIEKIAYGSVPLEESNANAIFVAESRTLLPEALKEIDRLTKELEYFKQSR